MWNHPLPEHEKETRSQTITLKEAAIFLGVSTRTLAVWGATGRYDLPFVKVGRRFRCRVADLEAWQTSQSFTRTGQTESNLS